MTQQRWSKAQMEVGTDAHTWWALIDSRLEGIRVKVLGKSLAQSLVDGLNDATPIIETTPKGLDMEVVQALVDEIEGSAERTCGHQNTGDGSPVKDCGTCMCWAQAQADAMAVRRHLGLV